jgi:hypothetical protein
MKRIVRNLMTNESRDFWSAAEKVAAEVDAWPSWKKAGINVAELRTEAREAPEAPGNTSSGTTSSK